MSLAQSNDQKAAFKLPVGIVSSTDLRRVTRQLEAADDFIYQDSLRPHAAPVPPPKITKLLADLLELNGTRLQDQPGRKQTLAALKLVDEKAPVMHINFAVEANPNFVEKIVLWARQNIDSHAMINIGFQPSVVIGCSVRTTNKVFDMSLSNRFTNSKHILNEKLQQMGEPNG